MFNFILIVLFSLFGFLVEYILGLEHSPRSFLMGMSLSLVIVSMRVIQSRQDDLNSFLEFDLRQLFNIELK